MVVLPRVYRTAVFLAAVSCAVYDDKVLAVGMTWFVYMLRCSDDTLYTGVTTDVARRVAEHNGEGAAGKGAKYTKARRPVTLAYQEPAPDRSAAQIREHALRLLSRAEKQKLAQVIK